MNISASTANFGRGDGFYTARLNYWIKFFKELSEFNSGVTANILFPAKSGIVGGSEHLLFAIMFLFSLDPSVFVRNPDEFHMFQRYSAVHYFSLESNDTIHEENIHESREPIMLKPIILVFARARRSDFGDQILQNIVNNSTTTSHSTDIASPKS